MEWRDLLKPEIQDFIKSHHETDVRSLALKKAPDESWPYALIMDQIKVRQKAKFKTPDLYDTIGFIFPFSDLFEQASSLACAIYKTSIIGKGERFLDLTAGVGVDGFSFSKCFDEAVFVERDELHADLLSYNAECTGGNISVLCEDTLQYVHVMPACDLVFIDPQRREKGRKGFFVFEDCSPDVTQIIPILKNKTKKLLVKASPLIDLHQGILTLGSVSEVHVVQWCGECKEVLFLLDFERNIGPNDVLIRAVDLDDFGVPGAIFSYRLGDESDCPINYSMPEKYIYEPDPAFQKAGGFKSMAMNFGLKKLHPNTHLYTSEMRLDGFCGRVYEIEGVVSVHRKSLKIHKADLKVRNFPSSVADLRKKLKLSDGGHHRVYATTLLDNAKKLVVCKK